MESLKDIISDIRVFMYGGVLTLPLTIAGTLSILVVVSLPRTGI